MRSLRMIGVCEMNKRRAGNPIKAFFRRHTDDLLVLTGCGLIVYGVSLISFPAAWISAGVLCFGLSVLVGIGNRRSRS